MIENNRYYWSHLKTRNVTVRVRPKKQAKGVVFRVGNMIDLGNGRQTVTLDHVDCTSIPGRFQDKEVAVPFRMGNIDFVYTSSRKPAVHNVKNLLSTLYKDASVERIVTDVLCPGDLLVFKQENGTLKTEMVETLRVVNDRMVQQAKAYKF